MVRKVNKVKSSNSDFEGKLWRKGYPVVAGVDEVGRGSLAGPIVAGCVSFPKNFEFLIPKGIRIDDSKKLTAIQRERSDGWIRENCLSWGVGEASVAQINRLGIKKAGEIAFRKAISKVNPNFLLIDAFFIPYVRGLRRKNQQAIINGDEKSLSIAAASIIAKVYRDRLMIKLGSDKKYKNYEWAKNKGYGTKMHQRAIKKFGVTKLHRKLFVRNFVSSQAR
jgi:ribonuclease HII